jgi:hypothetical protein
MTCCAVVYGAGLAATLGLIKDKGLLKDKTQWAGRNNDKKPVALIGLEDVYTGKPCRIHVGGVEGKAKAKLIAELIFRGRNPCRCFLASLNKQCAEVQDMCGGPEE